MCLSLTLILGTIVHPGGVFGEGDGPIFLSSLACDGTERSLLDCHAFAEIGIHNCLHSQDVGVTCIGKEFCSLLIRFQLAYIHYRLQ